MLEQPITTTEIDDMAKKTEDSVLDRLRALDEQRAELAEEARTAAMQQAEEAIEILNSLGGTKYHLSTTAPRATPVAKSATTKREIDPSKVCDVCLFATTPKNHDRRAHRGQGDVKRPFTEAELAERGWTKV